MNDPTKKNKSVEGGFGILPHFLRKAKNISSNAKLLFCALVELQHERGYCYATNNYLAQNEFQNVSIRSIQTWLSELEKEGWIKTFVDRNENNEVISRRIYVNLNARTCQFKNIEEIFTTPPEEIFTTPPESNFIYKKRTNLRSYLNF